MKIYRTINLKTLFIMLLTALFFVVMMIFVAEGNVKAILNPRMYITLVSMILILFNTILGDAHLMYLSPETHGYKYFRSLPDAYGKFRSYCLKADIIFGITGLLLLIPVIIDGFSGTSTMIAFASYAGVFTIQHFAHCLKKINTSGYVVLKGGMGGFIGASTISFAISAVEEGLDKVPPVACIIVCSVFALTAFISAVVLRSRLQLKWDLD